MIYLRKFDNHAAYEAAESSLILPNVSLCEHENEVHYNPSTPPAPTAETRVVATFNIVNEATRIASGLEGFSAIEIDGVELPSVVEEYDFSTTGEHTVKYTLADPTIIGNGAFYDCSSLTSITIPNSVTSIGDSAFYTCTGLTSIDIPNSVTSIGETAFEFCSSLTSCTLGSSVTSIGISAFGCCPIQDEGTRSVIRDINPDAFYCD